MNMGNIHLVTGYAGQQHVTAADQAAFNVALLGSGQFVLPKGNQLAASIVTNNQVRVFDGDICMQGRHIRLNEGSYVDLTIENGTQDYMRNDLIVVRYTKNAGTGIEDANLVVLRGTAVASEPVDPDYTVGDLLENHDILNDMPLYRVPVNGIDVQNLVPLFTVNDPTIDNKQDKTNLLTAETSLADADYIPFYDTSAASHRRVLWSRIKTVLGSVFAASSHSHTIADVTSLQSTLNGKAASSHSHTIADVTSLQSTLNGKAASSHTHDISDVTSLQDTLNGKAASTHNHVISDVADLQDALDAKAPTIVGSTTDVTAGSVSSYPEGTLYVVIE